MKYFLPVTILCSSIALPALATECIDEGDIVGVTLDSGSGQGQPQSISLLRETKNRVIYEFQPQGVTRVYLRYAADTIGYEEYFEAEKIGVEHEPSPKNVPGGWSEVTNFVSDKTLASLQKVGSGTYRCLATTRYEGVVDGQSVQAEMLDGLNLPVSVERSTPQVVTRWEITALETDNERASSISAALDSYRTYDFADLGDHEEEAFFRNSGYLQYKLGHGHADDHDH